MLYRAANVIMSSFFSFQVNEWYQNCLKFCLVRSDFIPSDGNYIRVQVFVILETKLFLRNDIFPTLFTQKYLEKIASFIFIFYFSLSISKETFVCNKWRILGEKVSISLGNHVIYFQCCRIKLDFICVCLFLDFWCSI